MRRALAIGLLCAVLGAPSMGCGSAPVDAGEDGGARALAAPPLPATAPVVAASPPSPTLARQVDVPAGAVRAGSAPGTAFRRPAREADEVEVELPAFGIDRHPYPNEPLAAPLLVTSRAEATARCVERGARLCTELEWERACEGDAHHSFPGGERYDADLCSRDPGACASSFGVRRLGETAHEWTASELAPELVRRGRSAVLRGARADAPADQHRCAARVFEPPEASAAAAFRCCHGPAPEVAYPTPSRARDFEDLPASPELLRGVLRTVPELAELAEGFEPYGLAEAERALACAGVDHAALAGWELAPGPFAWSPTEGEETWVLAGRSAGSTLVAVLYVRPGERFSHAASFVLDGETLPVAIARTPPSRGELQWSACWGRAGEGGVIRLGDDARIRVLSR
jgi:hypothetical protein